MSVTIYDPSGTATASTFRVVVVPAIADLNAPSLATDAADQTAFECALEEFGSTTEVSYTTRRKLCDAQGTQSIGSVTYGAVQLRVTLDDPQSPTQPLIDKFPIRGTVGLIARPGKAHAELLAAADMVQTYEALVASVDLAPITTTDGEEYEAIISLAIRGRNDGLLVPLVA